jgi:hypothetical protein
MTNIELQKAHAEIRACNAIADKYGNGVDWEERHFMCAMELYKMFLQERMVASSDKAADMAIDAAKRFIDKYIETY